jgi:lactoylglutathione lyase
VPRFDHLAIQVEDLEATRRDLAETGIVVGEVETPGGPHGPRTAEVLDPDGHRIELVQWPDGHPVAMTRGDFDPPASVGADAPFGRNTKTTKETHR